MRLERAALQHLLPPAVVAVDARPVVLAREEAARAAAAGHLE